MIVLKGKYNSAVVFTDNIDEGAIAQVISLCNQEFTSGTRIKIMPDVHLGKGCVIGTTMTIKDKIVPNLVGVDIGCGMLTIVLGKVKLDLPEIDNFIRKYIPHGFNINDEPDNSFGKIQETYCLEELNKPLDYFLRGIGSLGGGNHFIEIDVDDEGIYYLVIHSGSRNFGLQVANYYQNLAIQYHKPTSNIDEVIKKLKEEGRQKEIAGQLKKIRNEKPDIPAEFCYLEGELFDKYVHDLKIAQEYAWLNRLEMADSILRAFRIVPQDGFQTIHNYLDTDQMILRKGAIRALENERVLIPLNMRDGSLICKGKGNESWNFSAPHGAGRIYSRGQAKREIHLDLYKESMKGIYSSSVNESTLDESPFAYKDMNEIIDNIEDAVKVVKHIRPVYNFKA